MTAMTPSPELQLPWESSGEEDRRFHRIVRGMLAALLAVAITVPLLPVEAPERDQRAPQPPQLARILLEKQALPTPTPAPPRPQPKPEPKPVEAVTRPRPTPPEPAAKPLPTPQDTLVQAREAAQAAGVLAFRDELSELRDSLDLDAMPRTVTSRGEASAATVERAVITSAAVSNSGGINTAALSRDSGGPALSGRETTRVRSNIAGTDKQPASSQSAQLGGRSDESIRQVMDRNKGALFAIYNRALRQDPLRLVLPRRHPLAEREAVSREDLEGRAAVLLARPAETRAVIDRALREVGVEPRCVMESGNLEVVKRYVREGNG